MTKKDDRISDRLAAIKKSAPTVTVARIPEPKKGRRADRASRDPVFRPGKVYLSKTDVLRCVIRNVSDTGAYIHLEGAHTLPPVVVLRFDQTGVVKKARVAWQHDIEAGLAFTPDLAASA
ncbi:MAG: hypothetical protein R3C58_03255 [Parvularculaceae bacterium]